ncbi:MAG: hypothetical protein QF406_05725 [Verrucomicrobiota bacterium]|nr:hypothetical protein [Verrucomicrobiota bacterium]
MKKLSRFLSFPLVLGLIACGDKTTTKEESVSLPEPQVSPSSTPAPDPVFRVAAPVDQKKAAIENSFWAVNQHLDLGGSFYLYMSTEQVLSKLDELMDGFSAIADAAGAQMGEVERQQMTMAMDMGRTAYEQIGVRDISGFGMSSFAVEDNLNRNVMVLHHYPEKKDGLFWKIMGAQSHEQQVLKMLPAETVMAFQADLDLVTGFDWLRKFITDTAPPDVVAEFARGLAEMNQAVGFEDLFRSTGGEMGFFVTLNDNKRIPIPLPPDAPQGLDLDIPEPALAITLKVKDEQLMGFIMQMLKNPELAQMLGQSKEGNVTLYTLTPPELPLPIDLSPTLMQTGDYIVLTTSQKLAKDILAVKAGKNEGLAGTAEFKQLAGKMDLKGNQLSFMSSRLGKEFGKLTKFANDAFAADAEAGRASLTLADLLGKFSGDNFTAVSGQLAVLRVTPEGVVMESRSSGDTMGTAPLLLVGGAGIAASMLLPALAKAKAKANAIKSMNNAKQLGVGLIIHAEDNDGRLPAADKWCDAILREVGSPMVFASSQDPVSVNMAKSGQKVSSYAFNKALSGKNLNEVNPQTVIVFETDLGWNGSGGLKDALEFLEFFDGQSIAVGTADGTVRQVSSPDQLRRMRWEP